MSRIFKSNYVKVGTPKQIKSNMPAAHKPEPQKTFEVHQAQSLEEKANSIIEDAKKMYLRIIEEANQESNKIIDIAHQEKIAVYENAAKQGYDDGYNSGYEEGLQHAEAAIREAEAIKQQLDERAAQIYRGAEPEIMNMVLDITKKVIGQELETNPEVVISLIRQALAKCTFKEKLTLRVSESDYEYVCDNKDRITMLTEGLNDLEIQWDKALPKGSCIVETTSGIVNASVNIQIEEIERAFEYLMRNE